MAFRPPRTQVNAALKAFRILYAPLPWKGRTTMQSEQSAKTTGAKFGEVQPQRGDLPEFIKAEELSGYERFTIMGARERFNSRFNHQEAVFDVAVRVPKTDEFPTGVRRATITLVENDDRSQIRELVKKHGFLTGVRLDRIEIPGNKNGYWKFNDADTPRLNAEPNAPPAGDGAPVEDDEIPF